MDFVADVDVDFVCAKQDAHLAANQRTKIRCGDNGIFKGVPLTKEEIVSLVNETVKPLIDEAMKAVVDAVVTEDKLETDEEKKAAEAKMAYSVEGKGGVGSYMDFLQLPAANRG